MVWREQEELARLRRRFDRPRAPLAELVDACVDYLCRVEFVPMWAEGRQRPAAFGIEPSREHFRGRVNELRRFADPTAGDLGFGQWRALGGYLGLRGEALRGLAASPFAADWQASPLTSDVPVDHGRRAAWKYARQGHAAVEALVDIVR